jgi:hypothetical protein
MARLARRSPAANAKSRAAVTRLTPAAGALANAGSRPTERPCVAGATEGVTVSWKHCSAAVVVVSLVWAGLGSATAMSPTARESETFTEGGPGVGDPYFPLDGNRGYDVEHYGLDLSYHPATNRLLGTATIEATARKNLSAFNLDFDGPRLRSVMVNDRSAGWDRDAGELTITPSRGLPKGASFTTEVEYGGVPRQPGGFIHTANGAIAVGQPHVAAEWFPVNDHPSDKAPYTFRVTAPRGLTVVANGALHSREVHGDDETWTWLASEPMASYLATVAIGDFDLDAYERGDTQYWDAIDKSLLEPFVPRTGTRFAISGAADSAYQRLTRVVHVPPGGANLSFWMNRQTEDQWDFVFVEARSAGAHDWTTLPDREGHTSPDTGFACPDWLGLHPFLRHYQSQGAEGCAPRGTTGRWRAASGESDGWEKWEVDLARYAGTDVQVAIAYASDGSTALPGAFVDDIEVTTGDGTTSFEDDGDTMDGWRALGPPRGSPGNSNDWIVGTRSNAPPTVGELTRHAFRQQGEVIEFFSDVFGPYPFASAGAIAVDRDLPLGWARQTRPTYPSSQFAGGGLSFMPHEIAHQWFGDSLTVARWRHVWLNEGFASYADWLWSAEHGGPTPQEQFESLVELPARDDFWHSRIDDPGRAAVGFDFVVAQRGAMTLQQLRNVIGDRDFFTILRRWAQGRAGDNVTTVQFVRLAERVSGRQLDRFFEAWLSTPRKPNLPG